jgi:hypothetical protein
MTTQAANESASPVVIRDEPVFRWFDWWLYALITLVQLVALAFVARRWLGTGAMDQHPVLFAVLTVLLLGVVGAHAARWALLPKMRRPVPRPASAGLRVAAVTTFVPGGESIEMLEETVRAMVAMDYEHDTWVLDEGDSEEVRDLCDRLGARHFTRKGIERYQQPEGVFKSRCKHGNYNAFFDAVGYENYDIITGFDPDHVPEPTFLTRVLGYFDDPNVAYVQLPQVYYNQAASFIARGGAEETYSYYDTIQPAAHAGGWPIVTGCHHTHRVTALREINGFAPHDADDMLITYCYRQAGYRGIYSPEIQARGITPVDWAGYLRQQYRWARSVLDIKFRIQPRMDLRLPWHEWLICYLHGFYYVRGVVNLAGSAMIVYMLLSGNIPAVAKTGVFGLVLALIGLFMVCDLYRQRFFLDLPREAGLHVRAMVLQYAKWPVMLRALVDVVINTRVDYTLTSKLGAGHRRARPIVLPHAVIAVVMLGSWVYAVLAGNRSLVVEAWALGLGGASLLLIASEFLPFPPPFSLDLLRKELRRPVPRPHGESAAA